MHSLNVHADVNRISHKGVGGGVEGGRESRCMSGLPSITLNRWRGDNFKHTSHKTRRLVELNAGSIHYRLKDTYEGGAGRCYTLR